MMTHNFDWYLEHLDVAEWKSRASGQREVMANCPAHGGSDSLHVTERKNEVLLYCFNGSCGATNREVDTALATTPMLAAPRPSAESKARGRETSRETFDYGSATKTRVDYASGKKLFYWDPRGIDTNTLLYGSTDVPHFDRDEPVILVEGERKRDRLKDAGYQALSLSNGSSSDPKPAAIEVFRDRDVILWPDNDAPGHKVMDTVARSVNAVARSVRVVEWADAPETGDATDFLDHHTVDKCDALLKTAGPWEPTTTSLLVPIYDVPDALPMPLLLDYLEPEDHTILFGDGGTGKGVIAAQWIARLTSELGMRVAIIDYESHARYEWKPRLRQMGANFDNIHIGQPEKAIWDVAPLLRDEMAELEIDYVVIDSVTYACIGKPVETSETAVEYSAAIRAMGLPALSLAHTTKANLDPQHPFGSTFWSNGARLTIGVSRHGTDRLVQAKKVNARAPFTPQLIDWTWESRLGPSEVPARLDERVARLTVTQRMVPILTASTNGMTVEEITEKVSDDGNGTVKEGSVATALDRGAEFTSDGKKPAHWKIIVITAPKPSKKLSK